MAWLAVATISCCCGVNRKRIPVGWWCVAMLAWLLHATPLYPFVFALGLTAFVFAFGYASPWLGCLRFGDYSYGLYLWGYPMQQLVAHLAPQLTPAGNILLAWPLAMLLAVFSWHLVEQPALRLKSMPGAMQAKARGMFARIRADS